MTTTRPPPPGASRARRGRRAVREAAFGSQRRIGLWILPLFLITGLLGATLAGGLAVLYYAQQVSRLESTTAAARAEAIAAANRVEAAAVQAEEAIRSQVAAVEESLAQGPPITSPNESGVYAVAASHPGGEVRVGSAFTLFSDQEETFLVTNYRVIAAAGGTAVDSVRVLVPGRDPVGVAVHNFDRELDLAVLVGEGGPLPVLPWRPAEEPMEIGGAVFLAGVGGQDMATVAEGTLAGIGPRALAAGLLLNPFVSGGPLLDGSGRVVAVSSLDYAPFGPADGGLTYAVPIRLLCAQLLQCTTADAGPSGAPLGGIPVPGATAVPPPPSAAPSPAVQPPSPVPTPTPTPTPLSAPSPPEETPTE